MSTRAKIVRARFSASLHVLFTLQVCCPIQSVLCTARLRFLTGGAATATACLSCCPALFLPICIKHIWLVSYLHLQLGTLSSCSPSSRRYLTLHLQNLIRIRSGELPKFYSWEYCTSRHAYDLLVAGSQTNPVSGMRMAVIKGWYLVP
jgi:hypothetical protein